MLKLIITGNLGKAAEIRTLDSGDMAINFTVSVTEKAFDGTEITTWVECVKWVKKEGSTKIAEFLKKGQKVLVEGRPSSRAYIQADGSARSIMECRVYAIELLGKPPEAAPVPGAQNPAQQTVNNQPNFNGSQDDDIPF